MAEVAGTRGITRPSSQGPDSRLRPLPENSLSAENTKKQGEVRDGRRFESGGRFHGNLAGNELSEDAELTETSFCSASYVCSAN